MDVGVFVRVLTLFVQKKKQRKQDEKPSTEKLAGGAGDKEPSQENGHETSDSGVNIECVSSNTLFFVFLYPLSPPSLSLLTRKSEFYSKWQVC